jgi:hypothetical protein
MDDDDNNKTTRMSDTSPVRKRGTGRHELRWGVCGPEYQTYRREE